MSAFVKEMTMQDHQNGDTFTRDLFAWLHQVNADPDLQAAATKIALAISYHINRGNGEAWPSTITLAERASVNKSTASRMVRLLETSGHLSVENGCQGRGHSHRYRTIIKGAPAQISEEEKVRLRNGKGAPTQRKGAPAQRKGAPAQRKGAPTQKNYLNNQLKNHLTEPSDSPAAPASPASLSDSGHRLKADLFEQQGREGKEASKQDPPQRSAAPPREIATVAPPPDKAADCAVPKRRRTKPASSTKTTVPPELVLNEAMLAFATTRGMSAETADEELQRFVAYHMTKATLSASWEANWRTWVLNYLKFKKRDAESAPARVIDQDGNPVTSNRVNGHRMNAGEANLERHRQMLREMGAMR
jgi:hypothetical protein